ncbi:MAG: DUF192 domain-containing protein [Candidatus Levybacteria bacterium]|nr:DUF192 domain-containing protein [Candidatus Levybacteria bacterium]MDZ4227701.1 DUF192 domain-containing protein [Candidatus Levybacteria bacterium]
MKKVLLLFALLLIVVGGIVLVQNYLREGGVSFFKKNPIVTINNQKFNVSVASSQQEQEIGLSETKSLSQNQGMIFLFAKPDYYAFWMKNMKFPIDIIYINGDVITTIKNAVQPPKDNIEIPIVYTPTEPSDKVFEIQAGLSEKYNFKKGDKVQYENLGN